MCRGQQRRRLPPPPLRERSARSTRDRNRRRGEGSACGNGGADTVGQALRLPSATPQLGALASGKHRATPAGNDLKSRQPATNFIIPVVYEGDRDVVRQCSSG